MKERETALETICPANKKQWRKWLQKNHDKKQSVWVVLYRKEANVPTVTWSDAVDEALCFGWIDSTRKSIDSEKFRQHFSRRKPNSTWSKINKLKIKRLIEEGQMTNAGLKVIEAAKQNGSWTILDEVEELIIPRDLENGFKKRQGSKQIFLGLSRSRRRILLVGLVLAKQKETRAKRIAEIVDLCSNALKFKVKKNPGHHPGFTQAKERPSLKTLTCCPKV